MNPIIKILDNGMKLIIVPENSKICGMAFFIKTGSRNDGDTSGISHFLEHMLFKSTINYSGSTLLYNLDKLGASYNAVTSTEHTYLYIYGNNAHWCQFLDIILDIYTNLYFDDVEIETEKNIILEEMMIRYDSAYVKLYEKIHNHFFNKSTLQNMIIGNKESINSINADKLILYKKKWYVPDNTTFVITGDFDFNRIMKILETRLCVVKGNLPKNLYEKDYSIIMDNMNNQMKPYIYYKKSKCVKQLYSLIVFPMYDLYNEYNIQIDMIGYILSAGFSSRLNNALREHNGLTYSINAYPIVYSDSGLFVIQFTTNPKNIVDVLKLILLELNKLKSSNITNNELLKVDAIKQREMFYNSSNIVSLLKKYGMPSSCDSKIIDADHIKNISCKIFNSANINLFILGKTDVKDFRFLNILNNDKK